MISDPYWKSAFGAKVHLTNYGEMIDMTSGVICTNVGHSNTEVISYIRKMIDTPLIHAYRYPFDIKDQLTDELLKFVGIHNSRLAYFTTGAEAIECAIRLAVRWNKNKNKTKIAAFDGAFHGKTYGAALLSDIPKYRDSLLECSSSIIRLPFPSSGSSVDIDFDFLEQNNIGAIFFEGVQGSTMRIIDKAIVKKLSLWCKSSGCLLIADEIQTGFYRTGSPFYFNQLDIEPDIVVLGKGLTSSLPLSALILNSSCLQLYDQSIDSSTHAANPLAVAAALGCLKVYSSDKFKKHIKVVEKIMGDFINEAINNIPLWKSFPGGLMAGIGADTSVCKANIDYHEIVDLSRKAGVFISDPIGVVNPFIKLTPPLTIGEVDIEKGFRILKNIFLQHLCE